jgi:hypothetical protein
LKASHLRRTTRAVWVSLWRLRCAWGPDVSHASKCAALQACMAPAGLDMRLLTCGRTKRDHGRCGSVGGGCGVHGVQMYPMHRSVLLCAHAWRPRGSTCPFRKRAPPRARTAGAGSRVSQPQTPAAPVHRASRRQPGTPELRPSTRVPRRTELVRRHRVERPTKARLHEKPHRSSTYKPALDP